MSARKAKFAEHGKCLEWLEANRESNDFDPAVLDYPTAELYVAPDDSPKSCIPVHSAMVLESLGFADGITKENLLNTLELLHFARMRCEQVGIKEMIYLSSDERTDAYAEKVLGFKPIKAYRKCLP